MDYQMPVMDGVNATIEIKKLMKDQDERYNLPT